MSKVKFILVFVIILSFFNISFIYADSNPKCSFSKDDSINDSLEKCIKKTDVVWNFDNLELEWRDFSITVTDWIDNISLFLWIFAVWAIVYWALLMTLSLWEEEKITKAKDVVKWWIIGFVGVISASGLITLVIKIMYSI